MEKVFIFVERRVDRLDPSITWITSNIRGTLHLPCHLFPTRLMEDGTGIRRLQELLDYATIDAIQIYPHVTKKPETAPRPMATMPPTRAALTMAVRVTPRARQTAVTPDGQGGLKVRVTAPPAGGQANEAVVAAVADWLGLRRSQVRLVRGAGSRQKILELSVADATAVRARVG